MALAASTFLHHDRIVPFVHLEDLLPDHAVDLLLHGQVPVDPPAQPVEYAGGWKTQRPEIPGVDLGVAAELAEVRIDRRAVEEYREPLGQVFGKPGVPPVQDVQLVVECDVVRVDTRRVVERGDHTAPVLLGTEAVDQDVPAGGEQEVVVGTGDGQGVRLRSRCPGPGREPGGTVSGEDQGRVSRPRVGVQAPLRPEPDHAPRRNGHAETCKRMGQPAHVRRDPRVGLVRHDVQDTFRIVRKNQLVRLDGALQEAVVGRPERRGDPDRLRAGAPDPVEDRVLLQDTVIGEGGVAGVVDVDPAKGQLSREGLPEGPEVGPVHEAARRDRHELAAAGKELEREPDEGRVEVAGFDPRGAQARALRAVAPELAVRGVHDRHVESWMAFGFEEILIVGPDGGVEDEVPPPMLAAEGDPGLRARRATVPEGAVQIAGEPGVELPDGGVQGDGSAALGPAAELGHRRGRQDAAAAAGVEDPERLGRLAHLEHGGHEAGNADRREELTQISPALGVGLRPSAEVGPFEVEAFQEVRCRDGRSAIPARSESMTCVHYRSCRIPGTLLIPR